MKIIYHNISNIKPETDERTNNFVSKTTRTEVINPKKNFYEKELRNYYKIKIHKILGQIIKNLCRLQMLL